MGKSATGEFEQPIDHAKKVFAVSLGFGDHRRERAIFTDIPIGFPLPDKSANDDVETIPAPRNLKEFRLIWDWSVRPVPVFLPQMPTRCKVRYIVPQSCSLVSADEPKLLSEVAIGHLEPPRRDTNGDFVDTGRYSFETKSLTIEVPITGGAITYVDAQEELIRLFSLQPRSQQIDE